MVDPDRIERQIRLIRRYTGNLQELAQRSLHEFLGDPHAVGSTRYYLQVSIESCINIANHIIASEGFRAPRDYRDSFQILREAGILSEDLTSTMRAMAGLRNLLVHLYWEVDDRMIYADIRGQLEDFETFIARVLDFMVSQDRAEGPEHRDVGPCAR